MNRVLWRVLAAALVIVVGLSGGRTDAAPAEQTGVARIRFVNASLDAAGLDAYGDGVLWTAGLVDVTGYMNATPGEHVFSFRRVGKADDLARVTVTLESDQRVTIAAINRVDALEGLALVDDVSAPARNAARVKVVHAAPGAGPLALRIGGEPVAADLAYGAASEPAQIFAGTHTVSVRAGDESPLVMKQELVLAGSRAYTLFVIGADDGGALRLLPAESTVLKPDVSSQFRFANMVQGAGPLAVYVNHEAEPLFASVNFSSVTTYFVTGQGPHLVEVYPVGSGPQDGAPLAAGTAEVGPLENVMFVAQGTAESPEVVAYSADLSPVPAGSARLQVIHAAMGNPAIRVGTLDGETLFDRVAVGGSASRVIEAGVYAVRFEDAVSGETMMEQPGVVVADGTATVVIAFDDDPDAPLINAVTVPVDLEMP